MGELLQRLGRLSSTQRSALAVKLQKLSALRPGGGTRLVAYVVAEAGSSVKTDDLRSDLASRLPDYMIPSQIILLDSMPLTPNGKLDRAALPLVGEAQVEVNGFIEPRTETEKEIGRVWTDLLGVELIGIHDNFFEMGGHSLLVIQAIARLRDRFRVDLGVTVFFERPTIARLADYISEKQGKTPVGERDELEF